MPKSYDKISSCLYKAVICCLNALREGKYISIKDYDYIVERLNESIVKKKEA